MQHREYGHPVAGRAYTDEEAAKFMLAFESRDFEREEVCTTAISNSNWIARSEPLPQGYTATRSHGRDAYQIHLPHGHAARGAGRNQLPILIDGIQSRQVGVADLDQSGNGALVRFSRNAEGVAAQKRYASGEDVLEVAFLQQSTRSQEVPAALTLKTVNVGRETGDTIMSDAQEMLALAQRHNRVDMAHNAIAAGKSLESFRSELLESISTTAFGGAPAIHTGSERSFSLTRLINAEVTGDYSEAGYEREMCQEAKRNYAGKAKGIVIPSEAIYQSRATMLTSGNASGAVDTVLMGSEYIDALRPFSAVTAAGATFLRGLAANVSIPKNNADVSASWVAEGGAIPESDLDIDNVTMSPRMLAGRASFTRHLLATSNPQIDNLVRQGLAQQIANGLDAAALEGSGVGAIPTGVANQVGINTFPTAGGGTMTHSESLDALAEIAAANLDTTNAVWILNPTDAATLGAQAKDSGSGMFVYENGRILGRRAIESTHATQGTVYVGLWEHCLIGMWGGLDLIIDPYTGGANGIVNIYASQLADVAVRYPPAFQAITLTTP
ncbi:phage major capsid protein [Altererythrobacter sp. BO-6]|uniref:phage major capsid protein n=1 Tax=Altererythrobacter sp. BO-6 TaxID=2604537 RepID=UPI0013E152BD|nr:phage major capsid protein [Altererythrobacter sp. BO-6]QIG53807.1 phage major capsid protein [Altererythrobacter sp. BO-6]